MSPALIQAAVTVSENINQIHGAFGAPGNYGYETKEGKALFALYRSQVSLINEIKAIDPEAFASQKEGV